MCHLLWTVGIEEQTERLVKRKNIKPGQVSQHMLIEYFVNQRSLIKIGIIEKAEVKNFCEKSKDKNLLSN